MWKYNSRKKGKAIHIVNPSTGKTFCLLENGSAGRKLDTVSEIEPPGRWVCGVCQEREAGPTSKKDFYQSWQWAKLRFEVLKAYGPVCMCCAATENIIVDHIKPRSKFPELELTFENMQVLCSFCNRGKSNDDYTDFRPKTSEPELEAPEMAHLRDIIRGST